MLDSKSQRKKIYQQNNDKHFDTLTIPWNTMIVLCNFARLDYTLHFEIKIKNEIISTWRLVLFLMRKSRSILSFIHKLPLTYSGRTW